MKSDDKPAVIKNIENKAAKAGMPVLEYLAETGGPDMREIIDRMIIAEYQNQQEAKLT